MKVDFIERLIRVAEHAGVSELEYESSEAFIRFSLLPTGDLSESSSAKGNVEQAESGVRSLSINAVQDLHSSHPITSSLGGIFYLSPAPGEPAFVQVGDLVQEGQTVAIIEAMKMLNPIESPDTGRVSKILYRDGDTVEAGAPLFILGAEG